MLHLLNFLLYLVLLRLYANKQTQCCMCSQCVTCVSAPCCSYHTAPVVSFGSRHTTIVCRLLHSELFIHTSLPHLCFSFQERDGSILCVIFDVLTFPVPPSALRLILFYMNFEDAEQCLEFKLKTDILIMLSFLNIEPMQRKHMYSHTKTNFTTKTKHWF